MAPRQNQRLARRVGRGDTIRTCDFQYPKLALYQAELHPDEVIFGFQALPVATAGCIIPFVDLLRKPSPRYIVYMATPVSPSDMVASPARLARRAHILEAARALVKARAPEDFDAVRSPLCAIDVVMVAGSPWLQDGLERDFAKDEAGYRKIGGGANTPGQAYFFRSSSNLIHYLKRAGFYVPRGSRPEPVPGMACFFDWEDRGRFNFTPDRAGIVLDVRDGQVERIVLASRSNGEIPGFSVSVVDVVRADQHDRALVGYSDLP